MKTKSICFRNSSISYNLYGDGHAVLLIHGFGEDGSIWNEIAETLAEHYKLIIPDLPGSGKSEMLIGENISIEDYADGIKAIVENENIQTLVMIGHSMGGYITLAYQEKYPSDCRAIGLFHSTAYADDESKISTRLKSIQFIKEHGSKAFLNTSIPALFFDAQASKSEIQKLLQTGCAINSKALIQYYHAMISRRDSSENLKNLEIPVLIIAGKHDKAVPVEQSIQQSHLASICDFHILKKSAHEGMFEEKITSMKILANFLHFTWK